MTPSVFLKAWKLSNCLQFFFILWCLTKPSPHDCCMIVPSLLIKLLILMVSMSVVSPCGVLFTQGLRLSPTALHRLRQHRIHHLQPVVVLLRTWLAATCRFFRDPGGGGRGQCSSLLLCWSSRWKWARRPSSSSQSPSSHSVESSTSSQWVQRVFFLKIIIFHYWPLSWKVLEK